MYDCNKKGIPSIKMEMKHYTRKTSNKSGWKDKFYLIEKKNLVNVTNEKLERTWFITRKMTLTNCYHKIKKKNRDIFSSDKSRWYGSMRSKIHASVRLRAILCGSNTWTVLKHLYYKWYLENNKREEKGRRQDKKAPTPTPHIWYLISPWDLKIQVSMNRTDKPRGMRYHSAGIRLGLSGNTQLNQGEFYTWYVWCHENPGNTNISKFTQKSLVPSCCEYNAISSRKPSVDYWVTELNRVSKIMLSKLQLLFIYSTKLRIFLKNFTISLEKAVTFCQFGNYPIVLAGNSLFTPPPLQRTTESRIPEERSYRSLTLTNVVDFWGSGAK